MATTGLHTHTHTLTHTHQEEKQKEVRGRENHSLVQTLFISLSNLFFFCCKMSSVFVSSRKTDLLLPLSLSFSALKLNFYKTPESRNLPLLSLLNLSTNLPLALSHPPPSILFICPSALYPLLLSFSVFTSLYPSFSISFLPIPPSGLNKHPGLRTICYQCALMWKKKT